ncbi:uncharacterized protein LOC130761048 isoform X3 [Actinidia eriantha]|uniref:uncharacterized protein LOC130761048 isoform X3 n=1 Tax=Actinidia eriantha TaxID=165200 RepID=UPI00258E903E|nr:uncharacterized protein LOC130761048 isoform X3 [Actinidia eriantha]
MYRGVVQGLAFAKQPRSPPFSNSMPKSSKFLPRLALSSPTCRGVSLGTSVNNQITVRANLPPATNYRRCLQCYPIKEKNNNFDGWKLEESLEPNLDIGAAPNHHSIIGLSLPDLYCKDEILHNVHFTLSLAIVI